MAVTMYCGVHSLNVIFMLFVCRMDTVAELHQSVDTGMEKLLAIWDDIGIVGEQRSARNRVVLMHMSNLLDEMVREEDQLRMRLKQNVDKYRAEVTRLCTELSLPLYEVSVFFRHNSVAEMCTVAVMIAAMGCHETLHRPRNRYILSTGTSLFSSHF